MKRKTEHKNWFSGIILLAAAACLLPFLQGLRPYIVLSGSMEPAVSTGSIVIADTGRTDPEEGDIIIYDMGGTKVTHRVIRRLDGYSITKGDANTDEDPGPVADSQIIGQVVFILPLIGYLCLMLRSPLFLCLLLLLMLFIHILFQLIAGLLKTGAFEQDSHK